MIFFTSLFDEWQMFCNAIVNEVKENMPNLLNKPKMHLLLHLVECMHDFGPVLFFVVKGIVVYKYHMFIDMLSSSRI